MGKPVRSARGVLVDFDRLRIDQMKQQMTSNPISNDVRARQDFIEKKLRRRLKKVSVAPKIVAPDNISVDVEPKLPGVTPSQAPIVETVQVPTAPKIKQKARPK